MYTKPLSSNSIKLLSKVLHDTSKSIGRASKLANQREMLSKLAGYHDWNSAKAVLPEHLNCTTHASIALLELPSTDPKFFMTTGNDAPWRLPEKVRDHLVNQSLNTQDLIVSHSSRPDQVVSVKSRYYFYDVISESGPLKGNKIELPPHAPDYSFQDLSPAVTIFADKKGREICTITTWHITLSANSNTASNFTGATSTPLYNTFIESITGHTPEIRVAYCLVSSRQDSYANAIVKCNEMGRELEVVEHIPHKSTDQAWEKLALYNKALGLSLLDVADITSACSSQDDEY